MSLQWIHFRIFCKALIASLYFGDSSLPWVSRERFSSSRPGWQGAAESTGSTGSPRNDRKRRRRRSWSSGEDRRMSDGPMSSNNTYRRRKGRDGQVKQNGHTYNGFVLTFSKRVPIMRKYLSVRVLTVLLWLTLGFVRPPGQPMSCFPTRLHLQPDCPSGLAAILHLLLILILLLFFLCGQHTYIGEDDSWFIKDLHPK